jgi:hypothetical protein
MLDKRPNCIPVSRPRGVKALGLKYERLAGKEIKGVFPQALLGTWFSFADINGFGYCQPDIIVEFVRFVVVGECKLTETQQGREQIERLYRPVLEKVFGKVVRGVVITRHLTRETKRDLVFGSFIEAVSRSNGVIPTVHWLGKGQMI